MKRRPPGNEAASFDSKAEDLAAKFLQKAPKLFLYLGSLVVILVLVALIVSKGHGSPH